MDADASCRPAYAGIIATIGVFPRGRPAGHERRPIGLHDARRLRDARTGGRIIAHLAQPAERTSRLDLSAPIDRHRAAGGEVPLRPFRNERHFALLRVYSASFGKCSDILEVDDNACIVR